MTVPHTYISIIHTWNDKKLMIRTPFTAHVWQIWRTSPTKLNLHQHTHTKTTRVPAFSLNSLSRSLSLLTKMTAVDLLLFAIYCDCTDAVSFDIKVVWRNFVNKMILIVFWTKQNCLNVQWAFTFWFNIEI